LVKSGGRLVYATCSVLPEENEAIAEAFGAANPDFQRQPVADLLAGLKVAAAETLCAGGEDGRRDLRLWPHRHATDGFFAAVWNRK
jgi:16S rRNA (cytosine967-C5)-methyltransferase